MSSPVPPTDADPEVPELDDREEAILSSLPAEAGGRVAFQGLRRRLDLHQQALARTLQRLERYDLVDGDEDGYYRLAGGEGDRSADAAGCCGVPRGEVTLAVGMLPNHLDPDRIRHQLAGRWFRGLRWYGWRRVRHGLQLQWLTEPHHDLVTLTLASHRYAVHTEPSDPHTKPAGAEVEATAPLLTALTELFPEGDGPSAS